MKTARLSGISSRAIISAAPWHARAIGSSTTNHAKFPKFAVANVGAMLWATARLKSITGEGVTARSLRVGTHELERLGLVESWR
jgi:hypothetical protein